MQNKPFQQIDVKILVKCLVSTYCNNKRYCESYDNCLQLCMKVISSRNSPGSKLWT